MNFLLGVGAQRCGTSWLARYLQAHPQVFMTPYKELHFFDSMFAPEASGYTPESRFRALRVVLDDVLSGDTWSKKEVARAIERYAVSLSGTAYLGYFNLYARPQQRSIGEITPSYSLIPPEGFRFARELLVGAGYAPKVVFIMRDPLERSLSQLRYDRALGWRSDQDDMSALSSPGLMLRTRYDVTISNLRSQFPPDELLLLFYEELFSVSAIDTICRFLEIDVKPADFAERFNEIPETAVDLATRAAAREQLDVVYEFCADQFGRDKIRSLWRSY